MQDRLSPTLDQQDTMEITDKQKMSFQQTSISPTKLLPEELLLTIYNDPLLSIKDRVYLFHVNNQFHRLFQPEIGKKEVKDAAACAIYPTKENVQMLKKLLKACPPLLLHPVTVKNRHDMAIRGTVYQIALHEGDNELIDDLIKPAFKRLHHGLKIMEAQRTTWLPEGWMEAERKACEIALIAIDNVFSAFKNASNPNDVTELQQDPHTITINHQGANEALEIFRKAINTLYKLTNTAIESGRDPIIQLLERVSIRYDEHYNTLGGYNTPRNNALMRTVFGYCQRLAPINFMQAFAMGIYPIVEENEKLTRTFEYRNWTGRFILPLDSDPHFRLGYEYWAGCGAGGLRGRASGDTRARICKTFCQSKTAAALQSCVMQPWEKYFSTI